MKKIITFILFLSLLMLYSCGKTTTKTTINNTTKTNTHSTTNSTNFTTTSSIVYNEDGWDENHINYKNPNPTLNSIDNNVNYINYSNATIEEIAEISGKLESYLLNNDMLPLPIINTNSKFLKINNNITISTKHLNDKYPSNYNHALGIIEEAKIKNNEKNDYRIIEPKIPTLNFNNYKNEPLYYLNLISLSYFSKKIDEEKNQYTWYPQLATEKNIVNGEFRPLPINENNEIIKDANRNTLSDCYRIYVRTGEEIKYHTLSNDGELISVYQDRSVSIEDYLTPLKEYLNKKNFPNVSGYSIGNLNNIKGIDEYLEQTYNGYNEEAFNKLGIKIGTDDNGDYLQFNFSFKTEPIQALNFLSSPFLSPIPSSYLEKIGGIKNYMSYDNLINTSLSVGPYLIEFFNQNELILKKNNYINKNIIGGDNRYNFSNIHITIDEKANDAEYVYNLYKDGLVDFANVPTKFIQNEINQNDTYAIDGTPVSLNMNTCNQEMWEYLFGENGSIVKTDKENYWDLKPAMSNTNFIKGLQLSINRIEMANNLNTTPTLSFFAKYFYYDLENSIPYIYTKYHNENIINYYGNENIVKNFGFDLIEARKYFKIAANELLNNNLYQENDIIEIEICWQNQDQVNTYGEYIKQYLETAFNHQSVCNNKLTLKVNNTYTEIWSDVFYKKMMCGQYDLCYGFFSFGTNNLVKFFDLFKSNNSSGMTLNWGIDTNSINYLIEYNNQYFTYDALWMIVDHGGYVNNLGAEAILYDAVLVSNVLNEDSTRTVTIKYDISKNNNTPLLYIDTIELYGVDNYETILIDNYTENNGIITFTLNNNIVNEFKGDIIINLFFKGYNDEDWNYYRKSINSKNNLSLN